MIAKAKQTRTLKVGVHKVDIAMWAITKHGWEYYLEEPATDGIAFGYVMGLENDWGSVDLAELKPHLTCVATGADLMDVAPPMSVHSNMEWED